MKYALPLLLLPLFLLAACSTQHTSATLDDNLKNPYYAQRYYEDLSELMVSLTANKDPMLKDAAKKSIIERTRTQAASNAEAALARRQKGQQGIIQSDKDLALGSVVLLDGTLYFSADFVAAPGPSLHVYLTNAVDPRSAKFPDTTAVDLGVLRNNYGPSSYELSDSAAKETFRSVALYDKALGTIYAFAQLGGK